MSIQNLTYLPSEEAHKYLYFCAMNAFIHAPNRESERMWLHPFDLKAIPPGELNIELPLPGSLEARSNCFFDPQSALKACLIESKDRLYIVFGPIGSGSSEVTGHRNKVLILKQIGQASSNLVGRIASIYEQASALFMTLVQHPSVSGKNIALVGQSFGGSLAQYVGIKHQVTTICFNSLQIGRGLQRALGEERLCLAASLVTHICVKADFVSDSRLIWAIDKVFSKLIRTPKNFGTCYFIPSAFNNIGYTHAFVFDSLAKYLGFDHSFSPSDCAEAIRYKEIA